MKRSPLKKKSKTKISTLRNKCDLLLSPLIKKMYPNCLLCGEPTQVAHHHVHKSKSNALRYDLENLINLCGKCHLRLHLDESFWASKIVQIKGVEWFEELERKKNQITVKADVSWYENNLDRLTELLTKD